MIDENLTIKPYQDSKLIQKSLIWALRTLLFITVICIFVPLSPKMPGTDLDMSWAFGMNQAVAQGLAFGRDIIFTFGPYASIYTWTYHPATDRLMMIGSLYLALSYGVTIFLAIRKSKWYVLLISWMVLDLMASGDALFLSYPLLVGVVCFQLIDNHIKIGNGHYQDTMPFSLITALFLPFGLLALIKGTFLISCGMVVFFSAVLFSACKQWKMAIIIVIIPLVSIFFFWIASGQRILGLTYYLESMIPIASGYTEAMSIRGNEYEIIAYLTTMIIFLILIDRVSYFDKKSKIFIFFIFLTNLFLAFKGGFVRHDGHAIISANSLIIAALFFAFVVDFRRASVILMASLLAWIYIDNHYVDVSTRNIMHEMQLTYSSAWSGARNRILKKEWLKRGFNKAIKQIAEDTRIPLLKGTTDIYSIDQSALIASGNKWNPRPIFQSYSAYTPDLVLTNKNHLLNRRSPDNIILRLEPIDGRLPSIEDGASWPLFLTHYRPTTYRDGYLYLLKNPVAAGTPNKILIKEKKYLLGEMVPVPGGNLPIFAKLTIKQTLAGKLMNILFKPSQLQIKLYFVNGEIKKYRVVAEMMKTGFVISPLIESSKEFGLLYGDAKLLSSKRIKSFSITPLDGKIQWRDTYQVTFEKLLTPPPLDIKTIFKLNNTVDIPVGSKITDAGKCDGSIDEVNGASPSPRSFSAAGLLFVNGWLASSVDHGTLPKSVFVVLSDNEGKNTFFNVDKTYRPDVGAAFKKPELNSSGFNATIDVSSIRGSYSLDLAFEENDQIELCSQFKIPGNFEGALSHE